MHSVVSPALDGARVPMPAGWVVEPVRPCRVPASRSRARPVAAYPARDVTLALRAAVLGCGSGDARGGRRCVFRRGRGSCGESSYRFASRVARRFVLDRRRLRSQLGPRQVAQLEVIAPVQKGAVGARAAGCMGSKVNGPEHDETRLLRSDRGRRCGAWRSVALSAQRLTGLVGHESSAAAAVTPIRARTMRRTSGWSAINDLQGRESLVVTTLSDAANGSWVYVGHHESFWDQQAAR